MQRGRKHDAAEGTRVRKRRARTRGIDEAGTRARHGGGRGNYVFRESSELHSTEELWIAALPRCRCEEGHSEPPVTFSIDATDKRSGRREEGKKSPVG